MDTNGSWTKNFTDSLIPFPYCFLFVRLWIMKRHFGCHQRIMDQFIIYLRLTFLWKFISFSYAFIIRRIYDIGNIGIIHLCRVAAVLYSELSIPKFVSYKRVLSKIPSLLSTWISYTLFIVWKQRIHKSSTNKDWFSFFLSYISMTIRFSS